MICGYKYRIYPTNSQIVLIHKTFGCVRKMWNSLLAQSLDNDNKHYLPKSKRTKKQYSIKELKQEYGYMYEVDSHAFANVKQNLRKAWSNHFRKNSPSDEFYATLIVDDQPDRPQLAKTKQAVGIDLNIKNGETIVTSDGEIISKPDTTTLELNLHKQKKKLAKRLIVAHKLRETVWESMNYQKQRRKVAKTQAKIARIRKDWLHKVTWNLVNEYDSIHIEDLNVSGMVRNHHLAKHIVDSLFGEFRRQLTYKCSWYDKQLVLVDRWYPSSQLCSNCSYRFKGTKDLNVREWVCPQCGKHHYRDVNAAINILNYATVGTTDNA